MALTLYDLFFLDAGLTKRNAQEALKLCGNTELSTIKSLKPLGQDLCMTGHLTRVMRSVI
jgi:hypothetical protein